MTTYNRIKAEGREEGKAEGKVEVKAEIVLAMYADKIPVSQIAKYTDLSFEQINSILKSEKSFSL